MAGFTVGNTNIFTSNTFSATFNGLTVNNQLVFESPPTFQGETSGYTSGGDTPSAKVNTIDKFPFAIGGGTGTDVGNLTVARTAGAGHSSSVSGYTSGGDNPSKRNEIDKFPFSSDANATDVGDLTVARSRTTGQQV